MKATEWNNGDMCHQNLIQLTYASCGLGIADAEG